MLPDDIFSGGKECELCASFIGSFPFFGHYIYNTLGMVRANPKIKQ